MTAAAIRSREQTIAGALAFAMHVLFLVLLVFSVSWQQKQIDTAVVVDLWRDLPAVTPPKVAPQPKPVVKPEPPPPAPKAEVKPPPPKPEPAPKPDIALKEKLEKERKLKEQQAVEAKKLAAEKVRQAELEKKKRAAAEALKQKQAAEEAAAKSLAAQQQKARDALAAQEAAAAQREIDRYMDGIRTKVKRFVLVPPSVQGNPEAEVVVTLLPGGDVLDVRISKSSGNTAYDEAIVRAISRARPFVVPTGDQFQRYFRSFTMAFRPQQ